MSQGYQNAEEEEIAKRMDRLPISFLHIKTMVMAAFGPYFEAFDQLNITYVLPAMLAPLELSLGLAGLVTASTSYGMLLGTVVAGPLADRYGRKKIFQVFLLWFCIWSGVTALSFDFTSVFAARFIEGIGLGGELPVGVALISEILPRNGRRLIPFYQSGFAFGSITSAGVSLWLAPASPIGWRLVFVVGLLPAFYVFFLIRNITESPRWLVRKGRIDDARKVVGRFEASSEKRVGKLEPVTLTTSVGGTEAAAASAKKFTYKDLLMGRYKRRTLINSTYWFVYNFASGTAGLLTVLLVKEGFSLSATLTFSLIGTLTTVPGYWVSAYLLEKIGRRRTIFGYACVTALYLILILRTSNPVIITTLLLASNFVGIGGVGAQWAYISEQYPTDIRGTATSWLNSFFRLGSALGASVSGFWIVYVGAVNAYTIAAVGVMASVSLLLLWGIETRGKSLEEIQTMK